MHRLWRSIRPKPHQNANGGHGGCLGTYNYTGAINTGNAYAIGTGNVLDAAISSGVVAGTAHASSTALILSIVVPDGITWSYNDSLTGAGNPLHFQNASASPVPEPSTLPFLGLGLAGLAIARMALRKSA